MASIGHISLCHTSCSLHRKVKLAPLYLIVKQKQKGIVWSCFRAISSGVARGLAYIPLGWSCNIVGVSCGQGIVSVSDRTCWLER